MKRAKDIKRQTKIFLLLPGVVALVSLILCLVKFPYRPTKISDEDLSLYYDTAAIKQWYGASLPETAIEVCASDHLLLFSDISGECDTIKYQTVNDSVYRFRENDSDGVRVFFSYIRFKEPNDTNKNDSLLSLLVNRCLVDSTDYAFCGIKGDTLTFVRHDQLPDFTFNTDLLRQKLLNDTDYAFYGNVYAFLVGEKILEPFDSPDCHTYTKDDFTVDEGKFLCSVNPDLLLNKPITARGNTFWIVSLAIFVYSVLIIISYLIFVRIKKRDEDGQAKKLDRINEAVERFDASPKNLSDFVEFAQNVMEEEIPEADALAKLQEQAIVALKLFVQFLKEIEISNSDELDAQGICDFVTRLYKYAKKMAETLGFESKWFEKSDDFVTRLDYLVGCYKMCKEMNNAYTNKTKCLFGDDVTKLANKHKLLASYKQNLESAMEDALTQSETDVFVKTMNERFVANFRAKVHDNNDMGWFFENVLDIAFLSADFISYMAVRNQNIIYFPNYKWLLSDFDSSAVKKYVYHDARYSTVYADRIHDWIEKVDVRNTDFLIDRYKIKP